MFVRQKKNKSGSISVQIISKLNGRSHIVKSFGSSSDPDVVFGLVLKAKQEISRLEAAPILVLL